MNVLVVVDVQNDFVDGALGTSEAVAIIPEVIETIQTMEGTVFYTIDTHHEDYLQTVEGKKLPVIHCIKDTFGWEVQPDVLKALQEKNAQGIEKPTFGSYDLIDKLKELHAQHELSNVTLIGICTDICVISNALLIKAAFPNITIQVKAAACAGVTPDTHTQALEAMKMCHIDII